VLHLSSWSPEKSHEHKVPGATAELWVFRGEFARLINLAFPERRLHLFEARRCRPRRGPDDCPEKKGGPISTFTNGVAPID
jgi:hypothetical protein